MLGPIGRRAIFVISFQRLGIGRLVVIAKQFDELFLAAILDQNVPIEMPDFVAKMSDKRPLTFA